MSSALLEVSSLAADYADVRALWDVSLRIEPGEIVALVGPNGAGKTTLMRCIAGLHRAASGSIAFETRPTHELPPHRIVEAGVVLVPEGRKLFGAMSVVENLQLGAYSARARPSMAATLQQVLEIFPILRERQRQTASTMSGGQQQMLAIGRALMGLPRLLLLDEPSLGLAPLVVRDIFDVIADINRQGMTVLLVEQNARLALELANRAYILEQGRVVGEGIGAELLHDQQVQKAYLGYVEERTPPPSPLPSGGGEDLSSEGLRPSGSPRASERGPGAEAQSVTPPERGSGAEAQVITPPERGLSAEAQEIAPTELGGGGEAQAPILPERGPGGEAPVEKEENSPSLREGAGGWAPDI